MNAKKDKPGTSVLEIIKSRIVYLEYPPGAQISENGLAKQLGVSRTPVREAIQTLQEAKLLQVYPKRGTFVSKLDLGLVAECQFLRESVEIASLKSLELPITAAAVDQIEANLAQQKIAVDQEDIVKFLKLDDEFHQHLMRAAGHEYSWQVIRNAKLQLDRARIVGFQEIQSIGYYYSQHREIFDALLSQDRAHAIELLTIHVRAVLKDISQAQELFPELFSDDQDEAPSLGATRMPTGLMQNQWRRGHS